MELVIGTAFQGKGRAHGIVWHLRRFAPPPISPWQFVKFDGPGMTRDNPPTVDQLREGELVDLGKMFKRICATPQGMFCI